MGNILHVRKTGAVLTLTLHRPAAMNALSSDLRRALVAALAAADADDLVRVIILTGAGERAFCAGLDLKEIAAAGGLGAMAQSGDPVAALGKCRKPVIGAINGAAITGGFELALACDMLIASEQARFADTHVRHGFLPGWGLSQKLSRLIGVYRARELSLGGGFLDARRACEWGLVNRVVAPADLMPAAQALADDIARGDPGLVAQMKALINDGFGMAFADGMAMERRIASAHNGLK